MTVRPKLHGGYTIDRVHQKATYWTCQHNAFVAKDAEPPAKCAACADMTDDALVAFVKSKKIVIEADL